MRKRDEVVQVGLRINEWLRRALVNAAKKNGTSLNAEMLRRLEESFSYYKPPSERYAEHWRDNPQ